MTDKPLVSVVLPCLDEEEAIGACIEKIQKTFAQMQLEGEIIVCDNGSTDNSVAIAERMGVHVVHQPLRGYGHAYHKGFASASGTYLVMGDADDTYDFSLIPDFLDQLIHKGYDFVTGSRYLAGGHQSIPFLHRFFGNPLLTIILNTLFGTRYTDVYSGFRAFTRRAYDLIRPVSPGMEFNLELAINAGLAGLRIAEVPIQLQPRKGKSKLRTVRDGWRSLRMMLLYCPNKVFIWPGFFFLVGGLLLHLLLLVNVISVEGRPLGALAGIFATIFSVVGFEILSLGLHAKTYSWSRRFDKQNPTLERFYKFFTFEVGLIVGMGLLIAGAMMLLLQMTEWLMSYFLHTLHPGWTSLAATLMIIGLGTIFSSLFISAMSITLKDTQ